MQPRGLYDSSRKWFTLGSCGLFFFIFFYDAPFGRFSRQQVYMLDGRISWGLMEIVSPICFSYSLLASPLGGAALSYRQIVLALAYLIHYANRAVISPIMSPSRSKSSILVPLAGVVFNVLNGHLMGAYISSPEADVFLANTSTTLFVSGMAVWAVGLVGNIKHDMILMDLRRGKKDDDDSEKDATPRYRIPHGWLFRYISFPNYFCEWLEWLGYALAASPVPNLPSFSWNVFKSSAATFYPTLTPPWIFLFNEIVLMFPRAYRGQQWYRETFGDRFPKERKIVVPFVL